MPLEEPSSKTAVPPIMVYFKFARSCASAIMASLTCFKVGFAAADDDDILIRF